MWCTSFRTALFVAGAICFSAVAPISSASAKAAQKPVVKNDTLGDTTAPLPVVDDAPIDPAKKDKAQDKSTKASQQKSKR